MRLKLNKPNFTENVRKCEKQMIKRTEETKRGTAQQQLKKYTRELIQSVDIVVVAFVDVENRERKKMFIHIVVRC